MSVLHTYISVYNVCAVPTETLDPLELENYGQLGAMWVLGI